MEKLCIKCGQNNNLTRYMSYHSTYDQKFYLSENLDNYPTMCKKCYLIHINEDEEDHDIWFKCPCCNINYEEELFYQCEKCERYICNINCIKVIGCQTRKCICNLCFDHKCIKCNNYIQDRLGLYLWDGDRSLQPLCDSCK
ncbi:Hypothetical protein ORPV_190 [Orpheovirus IHUMI-LCC2]|uniref:Uncharacterized protein n=1 Tax=Orpheovirus IHUMI-LCC2 TaxID=2023057 RepID=A0A2I2L3H9_9VIRU|nr:Hypothetical protein ORPV_190 [Orpheovirus IHUMI-LCC2]SNW62094.1 Hypothetical protein ORPV_190 [Orpheovirus IHUMI-LCC2]